jgi:hypothetical protein
MRPARVNAEGDHRSRSGFLALLPLLFLACVDPLDTDKLGPCGSVDGGEGCLTLVYFPTASVRSGVKTLKGTLNWGLYKGGDVNILGPGNNNSVFGGAVPVDFGEDDQPAVATDGGSFEFTQIDGGREVEIVLQGIPARSYQALGYLDIHGTGDATSGDPVSLPSGSFTLAPGTSLRVDVPLDYIR